MRRRAVISAALSMNASSHRPSAHAAERARSRIADDRRPVNCDRRCVTDLSDAPVELIAVDEPYEGVISARRQGEPGFSHVQDVADAIMASLAARRRPRSALGSVRGGPRRVPC